MFERYALPCQDQRRPTTTKCRITSFSVPELTHSKQMPNHEDRTHAPNGISITFPISHRHFSTTNPKGSVVVNRMPSLLHPSHFLSTEASDSLKFLLIAPTSFSLAPSATSAERPLVDIIAARANRKAYVALLGLLVVLRFGSAVVTFPSVQKDVGVLVVFLTCW